MATKLFRWIKKMDADLGQIDILVEDRLCQRALAINKKGLVAQLKFLRKYYTDLEIRELIWHELQILRTHGMQQQSKLVPKKNISLSKKRRNRHGK